jgi:hypothetical protein
MSNTRKNTRMFRRKKQSRRKTGRVRKVMKRKIGGTDEEEKIIRPTDKEKIDFDNELKNIIVDMFFIDNTKKFIYKSLEKEKLIQIFIKENRDTLPDSNPPPNNKYYYTKKKFLINLLNGYMSYYTEENPKNLLYKFNRHILGQAKSDNAKHMTNIKLFLNHLNINKYDDNLISSKLDLGFDNKNIINFVKEFEENKQYKVNKEKKDEVKKDEVKKDEENEEDEKDEKAEDVNKDV